VAENKVYANELSTDECLRVIDAIASFSKPLLIMSGGEPMSRPDVFQLARYASKSGLPVVLAPCGHLINRRTIREIKESGIMAISISLDGKNAETHDSFRGVPGSFDIAIQAIQNAFLAGIPFQINTTVTKHNVNELPAILENAIELGAMMLDFFFLVPTGRGHELVEEQLSPAEYEKTINWICDRANEKRLPIRITCGPQCARIARERYRGRIDSDGIQSASTGCMAGHGFIFISHLGIVQPCGFLESSCGDLRENNFDLKTIFNKSEMLVELKNRDKYHKQCLVCEYWTVCGGCRARAFVRTGDYLGPDPLCTYMPERDDINHE